MSTVHDYVADAHAALAEARERIPAPGDWDDFNPSNQADLERGRLAQTRAITNAILAATAELHAYNISAAMVTGVVRLGTPAGGELRAQLLEHLGISTTAKES